MQVAIYHAIAMLQLSRHNTIGGWSVPVILTDANISLLFLGVGSSG